MKFTDNIQNKMLKTRNEALEKEVEKLKAQNKLLQTQLVAYKDVEPTEIDKKFAELEGLKNEYMKLNTELRQKLNEANEYIKQGKALVNKEGNKLETTINKTIKQYTDKVNK